MEQQAHIFWWYLRHFSQRPSYLSFTFTEPLLRNVKGWLWAANSEITEELILANIISQNKHKL